METRSLSLHSCIPAALVTDDAIIARDGAVTIGWECYPPEEYSVTQEQYDASTTVMASAFLALPEWTMLHKQDIYRKRRYHSAPSGHWLDDCYSAHFEGREYLQHTQYWWFTFNPAMAGRAGALKGTFQGAAGGIRYHAPEMKGLGERLLGFVNRCTEFMGAVAAAGAFRCRRLRTEDLEGGPLTGDGILEEYKCWFSDQADIIQTDGTYLDKGPLRMFSHSFARTDDLPGEVSNTLKVRSLSAPGCDILLSYGSSVGSALAHEHMVNMYWLLPARQHVLRELDRRRRGMTSMSKGSAENSVHAEGISRFIEMIHSEATAAVYTHMNVISWGAREDEPAIRGETGAALAGMGLSAKLNTVDTPQLWLSAFPGGEMEIGEDNLFIAEIEQAMCLSIGESFMRDFPGGKLRITDRRRHTPVALDLQEGAFQSKLIENYNAFILGPSGSGKSFFTAWFARNCYDSGQEVFIIDKGGSYEGLAALIREETSGRDGVYYTWSSDHPYAFNPLTGCRGWTHEKDAVSGLSFFVSLLKIIWTPAGGWTSASDAVLFRVITDFLGGWPEDGDDPVFDDFLAYLRKDVLPRILGTESPDGSVPEPYIVGGVPVTQDILDVSAFCIALDPYARDGRFGEVLNERHPSDLFASRFVVFEVDAISEMDRTLYAVCTFCIIHAFERKMRSASDTFRLMLIEEAWQAIATEGTADYLRGLWKTARKWHTCAAVVTQQLSDIISSPVVKDAIISNSPVKILLDQRSNAASYGDLSSLLGLSPIEEALVRSVGRDLPPDAPYREVFISLGGKRSGVYALEVSPEEALVYESDHVRKRPLKEKALEMGSIRRAVLEFTRSQSAKP